MIITTSACILSETFIILTICGAGTPFNVAPEAFYVASLRDTGGYVGRGSYFGYSVGILERKNKAWLLVGAPRANSSTSDAVLEPGLLFKCEVAPSKKCEEIVLDHSDNFQRHSQITARPFRDHAWTGMSLDIDQEGNVVVCAPCWKDAKYKNEYKQNGACYIIGPSLESYSARIIVPLLDSEHQLYNYFGTGVYYFTHGEAGLDAHFTKVNGSLLLGAPGILNWQGSVVRLEAVPKSSKGGREKRDISLSYGNKRVPNPIYTNKIQDFNLFGYSVTSGNFDNERGLYYVAGAPKGAKTFGSVFVFLIHAYNAQPLIIKEMKSGTQMGEYFGASVAAPDLNGDGLSDLIVGAPLHSINELYDVGCVYVFMNSVRKEGTLQMDGTKLLGDTEKKARFGTALGTPGDLDLDGFEDLLIGAPYENDESGAVYVFMGSKTGIREKYSQKLVPKSVSKKVSMKGFGISFSRPANVDKIAYPDFAIGSYLSDNAVIMVTRPVITIQGEISAQPTKLSLTQTSFVAVPCIIYTGTGVPEKVDINIKVNLSQEESEEDQIQANFRDTKSTEIEVKFAALIDKRICKTIIVDIILEKNNAQNPFIINMAYNLLENKPRGFDSPVMNPYSPPITNFVLPFVTGCEKDVCHSDLETHAYFEGLDMSDFLLVGKLSKLTLKINVTNNNEPAFLPNVTISIPVAIRILPSLQNCMNDHGRRTTVTVCQLRNPINQGETDSLSFDLDISELDDSSSDIHIDVSANSAADFEENPINNNATVLLILKKKANMDVNGWSDPEQYTYKRANEGEIRRNESVEIHHTFSISKLDTTPLREVRIIVDFPVSVKSTDGTLLPLAKLVDQQLTFHERIYECEETGQRIIDVDSTAKTNPKLLLDQQPRQISTQPPITRYDYKNKTLSSLNCSSEVISCASIVCAIGPWERSFDIATLKVKFILNSITLNQVLSVKNGASYLTEISARITSFTDVKNFEGKRYVKATVHTNLQPGPLPAKILAWWIYLLAVLGGILLLVLISYILYKVGFFRRRVKEDMRAQKATLIQRKSHF